MRRRVGFPLVVLIAIVLVTGLFAAPASAQSLDELRASGAIGERYDGLVEARDPGAAAAVKEINAKRQEIYTERAASQGVAADQVGRVYAKEILQKAPAGTWFLAPDNTWTRK